ncbi:N-acetylmuramoyl-L-alanine amidase [Deinococcus metallilatus]|uniref:N-acetylmuramoyl-L-alanine amidase n=1 Tax=Deinococcus metallilatus TaxID=1211322 RepID=A0AAJ5F0Y9_9DEIO|nr:N-acetylmuramoyl-L-alanine amidase [Deinococcus metallilatus]MBB5297094.1 N-acetylmuramoyl-L-alanine amidase [Deinococcus metallilatus]QBY07786.1 N-acetylmuramoyl-L-alanine amidase [Deinococcus metallilatus]RXJ13486.1 N-acetylmuramoyl-L-alanine amidase [Deinococcus metallilatus]TLK22357.1 N-acetylmuramoyl-L-alanine amidase [Deinococcus metallilatus]GMA17347.1 N-acetylmuramoyl-L-alanine amidase [Deinococcus metallilatus]
MKRQVIFLSSVLSCGVAGSWAAAQADPFQRAAPAQAAPSLRGTPAPTAAAPTPGNLTGAPNLTFGAPRSSSDGSQTRVVFDLVPGMAYTLTPTFGGLRVDVRGARVLPAVSARLGASVTEYRAGGGQVTLVTPFPLSLTEGWRASEATLAAGTRVLILDFGPTLSGGASAPLRALVRMTPTATTPDASRALTSPLNLTSPVTGPSPTGTPQTVAAQTVAAPTSVSQTALQTSAPLADQLPPGDAVPTAPRGSLPPPAPALPGQDPDKPSALAGRAPGNGQAGAALTPPRVGKNPGMTRVVLDLPPGTTYRVSPGGVGLRLDLSGVSASAQMGQDISPELRGWRYEPGADGVTVTLLTGTPLTARSGWRAQLVPPTPGSDRSRLAIDLSPALADLTPLTPRERVVATVPLLPAARGTAILAFSTSMVQPRVVIDPGHGGSDPGAVGAVVEKQVTLDVALRVRDLLRQAGVDAVLTRDSDRELNPVKNTDLVMRAAMGGPGTQLFLSIHVNAMPASNALHGYGVETWWNPNHPLSNSFAALIQKNVVAVTGAFPQGLRNNRSLAVLRNSRIPAALVEIGYTSHPVDGLNLKDTNYLDRVALGIAQGIREALVTGITAGGAVGGAGK